MSRKIDREKFAQASMTHGKIVWCCRLCAFVSIGKACQPLNQPTALDFSLIKSQIKLNSIDICRCTTSNFCHCRLALKINYRFCRATKEPPKRERGFIRRSTALEKSTKQTQQRVTNLFSPRNKVLIKITFSTVNSSDGQKPKERNNFHSVAVWWFW
jgi:hypothetical protein